MVFGRETLKQKVAQEVAQRVVNQLMEAQKIQQEKNQKELLIRLENWEKEVRIQLKEMINEELGQLIEEKIREKS